MATRIEFIEHYHADGTLSHIETIEVEVDVVETPPPPPSILAEETHTISAKRLEVAPDIVSGHTSIILIADDGSRMELFVKPDGTLGIERL